MAEEQQGNIRQEFNNATVGLNMDQSVNQIKPGTLTYALNASVENFDATAVNYQNEPGNELCVSFPDGYSLIGTYFIQEKNKHIFFLLNISTGESEIGQMINNDCVYRKIVNANCLNFNINHPIHKVVHRITNCSTEIYWTDGLNSRRYLDLDNIPYISEIVPNSCDLKITDQLDCNRLKIQPDFKIPQLSVIDVVSGGELLAGTYQFAIQYADALGNPYTNYYSITNPCPIADPNLTTVNFNYNVGKSIIVDVSNLDASGQFRYFNLAVIKTINAIPSVELIGTYNIDNFTKQITYTGQDVSSIRLSINDIFEKYPYYDVAQDVTAVQDILVWDQLTTIDRVNYQHIANKISLNWESWRIPASENYSNEFNATNLRGYLRDEIYSFEIVFLLQNGKQTDGFHIPGRTKNNNEFSQPNIFPTNPDFIGEPDPLTGSSPYWKIYNTASVTGTHPDYVNTPSYKGPYQYGEFAYWESTENYPCNEEVWEELSGQPIRHHKFPDILISPAFESATPTIVSNKYNVEMQTNNAIYPLGVKVSIDQIKELINASNLSLEQKNEIVGFKIVRGNRGTNKSIVAKGMLRNVGSYERKQETFYYPNYPYNDLGDTLGKDPFLGANNNAYLQLCEPFEIVILKFNKVEPDGRPYMEVQYTDCNVNKTTTEKYYELSTPETPHILCSLTKPTFLGEGVFNKMTQTDDGPIPFGSGDCKGNPLYIPVPEDDKCIAYCSYANYDVWQVARGCDLCRGWRAGWSDAISGNETQWIDGSLDGNCRSFKIRVRVDTEPSKIDGNARDITRRKLSEVRVENCKKSEPLSPLSSENRNRQIFNSPETSFGQPFLGDILKLENVMYGAGKAHFVEVKDNAKYRLISKEAQQVALDSSRAIAVRNISALFAAYQAYLEIYINGITRRNYAYSFNSIASYDYSSGINNNLGIKQRTIDLKRYLIPGIQNVGDKFNINNYNRETSVFLRTELEKDALPFPNQTPSLLSGTTPLISDYSRFTIGETNACATPEKEQDIKVVSYYASLKNNIVNQWGQIYSYDKLDTGFQIIFNQNTPSEGTVFGGDTFISKFAYKTKLPFFIQNRVNAPDDSDVFYDELGNIAYPIYWHSARSILSNYEQLVNFISIKATNFDCPNDTKQYTDANSGSELTYYDGYFYMFAYGIPSFYCETSYNLDLRQAFNNREGEFWPHVSSGIPDDWVQQSFVPIEQDNTYYYNVTFSKQNSENIFTNLPSDWKGVCSTVFPFRAIYSDVQGTVISTGVTLTNTGNESFNNWLIYRAVSYFDFPQNYGNLISLDGIQNKAILARFENKTLMYNNLLTIDTSNPQAAYVGNNKLFAGAPPIDFAETDLGYVGTQNKMLLKIPQGQITVDAKRGQIFLISGTQAVDLTGFGSGVNRFMTDHLAFEILRYFPDVDTDNHFNGIGLHGVYDSKFDRVIITKIDYVPVDKDVKYDADTREFYIETTINNYTYRTQVFLDDRDFFCNKSWTISFNFNTKSWVSFHSYIPNFYIAENNFFYSGINGCCDSIDGEVSFKALVGEIDKTPPTTTSTTTIQKPPITSTTSTTMVPLDCQLEGEVITTDCELEGEAYITVPPTTTTTICARPFTVQGYQFITGYINDDSDDIITTNSFEEACSGISLFNNEEVLFTFTSIPVSLSAFEIGQIVYENILDTSCNTIPDGWYYTGESAVSETTYHVVNGIIVDIVNCSCGTITTTTTIQPVVNECCNTIVGTNDSLFVINQDFSIVDLNVHEYTSSEGIAISNTLLWSIDNVEIKEWNITLHPFTSIFNRSISLPLGFSINSGILALDYNTLLAISNVNSPQEVIEIEVAGTSAVVTVMFTLPSDRIAISNPLYTANGKLIIVNQDLITSDYYISQYNYATATLEIDSNIGTIEANILYSCDCNIYVIDTLGDLYLVTNNGAIELEFISNIGDPFEVGSQIMACVTNSLNEITTTTTTTASPTTTTTTTL
jgi:hypothetical protein